MFFYLLYHKIPSHLYTPRGIKKRAKVTLYQEQTVFGKMKMDPAKRAQTQNAGLVPSLEWFFSQSVELMTDKVLLHFIRPMLLK